MHQRLRKILTDRVEAYLDGGPANVSYELALGMRRARGFTLIGQIFLFAGGVSSSISLDSPVFLLQSLFTMAMIAGLIRIGAMSGGRYFWVATHAAMGVMLGGVTWVAIYLGYANPVAVTFSVLIILSASYILGPRAAVFWTAAAIVSVSYAALTSDLYPLPPEAVQLSMPVVVVSRVLVLMGTCAIATAERIFSDRQSRLLVQLASHDSLTGLLNRRAFDQRLTVSLARARRHKRRVGLIFLDLDEFKRVNDEHGHIVGDTLLRQIGHHLASITREGDAAGRAGGDEFMMLLEDVGEAKDVTILAERILAEIEGQVARLALIPDTSFGVSIGAACFPDDAGDSGSLIHAADLAMYRAKDSGGGAVRCA